MSLLPRQKRELITEGFIGSNGSRGFYENDLATYSKIAMEALLDAKTKCGPDAWEVFAADKMAEGLYDDENFIEYTREKFGITGLNENSKDFERIAYYFSLYAVRQEYNKYNQQKTRSKNKRKTDSDLKPEKKPWPRETPKT